MRVCVEGGGGVIGWLYVWVGVLGIHMYTHCVALTLDLSGPVTKARVTPTLRPRHETHDGGCMETW